MYAADFIQGYFAQEKIESLIFLILGISTTLLAIFFLFIIKYSLYNGIAYPFLLIGIIQITVGLNIFIHIPKNIERTETIIKYSPTKIKTDEIPRMEKIIQNFKVYKIIEIVLFLFAAFLYFYFFSSKFPFWKGLALGLLIQSSIMLALDLTAEDGAVKYLDELIKFTS